MAIAIAMQKGSGLAESSYCLIKRVEGVPDLAE
jgi:hypothetical protein